MMAQQDYEQKKSECWEKFCRANPSHNKSIFARKVFNFAFDRAYALGKIDGAKKQKERDDHYIEMQKAFARFDKACDKTIHTLDKLTNTLDKL